MTGLGLVPECDAGRGSSPIKWADRTPLEESRKQVKFLVGT